MPLEIERRFLVSNLTLRATLLRSAVWTTINQTYLLSDSGVERVRKATTKEVVTYTHTRKFAVSKGVAEEVEVEVTAAEYVELLYRADPTRFTLKKQRATFEHGGLTWELDIFTKPPALTILEVELDSLDVELTMPPMIPIVREITGESEYSNYNLSLKPKK